ncbi:unnamed protein product [Toxocara canis]|uniref:Secreted protein n=1 Tax=Toxocara canis TaxID=6265 RepID=A0A183U4L9_TOXCA|nr:unnamed protein product [Toxocara canis]
MSVLLGITTLATLDSYVVQTCFKTVLLVIIIGVWIHQIHLLSDFHYKGHISAKSLSLSRAMQSTRSKNINRQWGKGQRNTRTENGSRFTLSSSYTVAFAQSLSENRHGALRELERLAKAKAQTMNICKCVLQRKLIDIRCL